MGKIIAVVNQKGGVGKTTTTVNTASAIAARGKKVLIVDIDPQGNATIGLGLDKEADTENVYHLLLGSETAKAVIKNTNVPGLDIIPSNIDLAGGEVELVNEDNRESRLRDGLAEIKNDYDYIYIDSPPSLGLLTINSLVAADACMIPMQCEFYALDGLAQLLRTVTAIKESLNEKLTIDGVVITMFDSRTSLSLQVVEEIKKKFKDKVYDTVIPRNVSLSEAPSFGEPIDRYEGSSRGAAAYDRLAAEITGIKHPLQMAGKNKKEQSNG
ncbi:MAG: ParA family protein [Spirochaetia bacterium]|nr:ParA family protein [Spirochaetia bacterium]